MGFPQVFQRFSNLLKVFKPQFTILWGQWIGLSSHSETNSRMQLGHSVLCIQNTYSAWPAKWLFSTLSQVNQDPNLGNGSSVAWKRAVAASLYPANDRWNHFLDYKCTYVCFWANHFILYIISTLHIVSYPSLIAASCRLLSLWVRRLEHQWRWNLRRPWELAADLFSQGDIMYNGDIMEIPLGIRWGYVYTYISLTMIEWTNMEIYKAIYNQPEWDIQRIWFYNQPYDIWVCPKMGGCPKMTISMGKCSIPPRHLSLSQTLRLQPQYMAILIGNMIW